MNQEHMPAQGPVDVNVRERIGYCPVCETHRPSLPAPAEGTCAFCHNHLMKPCRECLNHDATGNGEQRCKGSPAGVLMAKCAELEAELSTWIQAVGLASTIKPDMVIDVSDPIGMMQKVVGHVEQLKADREKLLQLLKSASEVIGRFVSDEGWAQSDMDHEYLQALSDHIRALPDEMVAHEVLNGGWVSFDMAKPEGPNLVQQYLGDSVLDQQDPPFWAFPTSRWRGAKELYATHWRYVQGPHE